jgi:3-oxo-5-alpha-steroid 4-dehydrogenase 3
MTRPGAILESWEASWPSIRLLTPRTLVGGLLFLFASYKQNEFHRHLASLKKYTLPTKGWFRYIICPHYTSECLVYVAMSIITAPRGSLVNRTVLCGLVFAAGNIGLTAHGTKRWYADKFGADKVAGRWKMIPLVY